MTQFLLNLVKSWIVSWVKMQGEINLYFSARFNCLLILSYFPPWQFAQRKLHQNSTKLLKQPEILSNSHWIQVIRSSSDYNWPGNSNQSSTGALNRTQKNVLNCIGQDNCFFLIWDIHDINSTLMIRHLFYCFTNGLAIFLKENKFKIRVSWVGIWDLEWYLLHSSNYELIW